MSFTTREELTSLFANMFLPYKSLCCVCATRAGCLSLDPYPAKKEQVKGRDVGPEAYRNRLWAYIEERIDASKQTRDLVKTGLQDLGSRIDKIDILANKGLHADITLSEIDRLLIALVTVAYDLLSLTPPPTEVPIEPHLPELYKFIEAIEKEGRNEEKNSS